MTVTAIRTMKTTSERRLRWTSAFAAGLEGWSMLAICGRVVSDLAVASLARGLSDPWFDSAQAR